MRGAEIPRHLRRIDLGHLHILLLPPLYRNAFEGLMTGRGHRQKGDVRPICAVGALQNAVRLVQFLVLRLRAVQTSVSLRKNGMRLHGAQTCVSLTLFHLLFVWHRVVEHTMHCHDGCWVVLGWKIAYRFSRMATDAGHHVRMVRRHRQGGDTAVGVPRQVDSLGVDGHPPPRVGGSVPHDHGGDVAQKGQIVRRVGQHGFLAQGAAAGQGDGVVVKESARISEPGYRPTHFIRHRGIAVAGGQH
mmetsp:Transcript_21293/g.42634  ORF Transcript_21293/g.42634 Transcript_21293/m.42634 type:complete len:245 (-) Transcript_21293:51-785(-)